MTFEKSHLRLQQGASLRLLAIDAIRTEISEGRLAPGSRLVERDLCDALDVSRTVVREAIRHLEAEGYVATASRQGPIVAPMDFETVRSIYEIREILESRAAALYVERASESDKEALRSIMKRFVVCEKRGEHVELLKILREFHNAVNKGAGNLLFDRILVPLNGRIHMLQVKAALSPKRRSNALKEIRALAEALTGDDPAAAASLAKARLVSAAQFGLQAYAKR